MAADIGTLLADRLRRVRWEGGGEALDRVLAVVLDGIERDLVGVGLTPERRADVIRLIAAAADADTATLPPLGSDAAFRDWVGALQAQLRSRDRVLAGVGGGAGAAHLGDTAEARPTEARPTVPAELLAALRARPMAERVRFSEIVAQVLNSVLPQADSPGRRLLMSVLDSYLASIPGRPILYRGRPEWLTLDAFDLLRAEAADSFERALERYSLVEYAEVSPVADRHVEEWTEFRSWIDEQSGLALAPQIRKVTFQYNRATDHLPWHIDKPNKVALNCLIMLERSELRQSALQLYTHEGTIIEVDLEPGEVLLFKGDATPHRRTPLADGEFVRLMSIGFMLAGQP
ncbi:hypothetical protein [Streptacidiphilus pinicola]|nr:hypothetical protein [Streptacidiphilus pinicola]